MIDINNRRYIGSKTKLINKIYEEVEKRISSNYSFGDIFAGTGVVAYKFALEGHPVILNDTLYSNYISYQAWFGSGFVDNNKLIKIIDNFNQIKYDDIKTNYFSNIYSYKYYSQNDAKKIGFIRDEIEKLKTTLSYREYCVLLTSLMYTADKIANTVGHFEHYLKHIPTDTNFKLEYLHLRNFNKTKVYQQDANELVRAVKADVIYVDPPYNARQYVNFYHVLENLITWEKPQEFEGISMKFKRDHLKSGYSRVNAKELFEDLIRNIKSKLIVVSYNNTYKANSTASNNRIQEEDIIKILKEKGKLEIVEMAHKYFNSGKTKFNNHKEKLYICTIERS